MFWRFILFSLFMSIKAGLYITPEWLKCPVPVVSPSPLVCPRSPQGEASQHSPAGGRLRDQKRVLPLPRAVSSDVCWVEGKRFSARLRSWSVMLNYMCWLYTRGEWAVVARGPEDMRGALHSARLAFILIACELLHSHQHAFLGKIMHLQWDAQM